MDEGMDPELVARAQRGDQRAFEHLTLDVYHRLHTVAFGILRDASLAEDAIQQTVLTMWRELPKLREPARFEGWTYRILVNACHAEGRRLKRWITTFETRILERPGAIEHAGTVLDRDQLERAFRRLSVDHRAIVVLRYYTDLTIPAIAEALDIPSGTVSSRLHHAMKALRASLEADERAPLPINEPPEAPA